MLPLLLIGFTGLYTVFALGAARVVRRMQPAPPLPEEELPRVSVLVAARNEEQHLPRCLAALARQDYPADRIAFIVADDHSTDGTPALLRRFCREDRRFRSVTVPPQDGAEGLRGKARVLHHAIGQAGGALLLITDADCVPPPQWARHLAAQFRDPRAGVVCGVTVVAHASLLDRIQALDWLLLLTVAAAAADAGLPVTAMGNNMAVRRAAYEAVGGYPALPFSVTEDYALFQAVHRAPGWRVRLLLDDRLLNVTHPLPTLRQVFAQRKRWARGGLRAPWWVQLLYLTVFLTHLLLLVGLLVVPAVAAPLLGLKLLAHLAVVRTAQQRLGAHGLLRTFPLFEMYLFGYVIAMPLALLFAPRIHWKGRRF